MPENAALCDHVRAGAWPFRVRLVLDEHPGLTDALVTCRHCGRTWLLEMLDWRGDERVLRVSPVDEAHAAALARSLERGSCDLERGARELHHLRTSTPLSRWLLLVDATGPVISGVVPVPPDVSLPGAGWRELPCDGRWVDYARSNCEIVNE